eukprot:437734_1
MANDSFPILNIWWSIIGLIIALFIFIYHSYKLYQHNGFKKKMKLFSILSLLLINQTVIGLIVFIITEMIHENDNNRWCCEFAAHWGPTGYSIFKFILYYILILRFKVTFRDSSVKYNINKLRIWVLILFTWTTSNIIAINITAQNIPGKCEVATPPIPIMASIASIDFVACIVNTILFSRPLFQLHKKRQSTNQKRTNTVNFKYVAIKQCILSLIAVLSTIFALLVVSMLNLYVICISFDYVISTSCIILMYSWNSSIIDKICCCKINSNKTQKINVDLEDVTTVETVQTDADTKLSSTLNQLSKSQNNDGNNNEIIVTLIGDNENDMNFVQTNFEIIDLQKQGLQNYNSNPIPNGNKNDSLVLRTVNSEPLPTINNFTI